MGPQHIAAENFADGFPIGFPDERFNGAAAHRCGKLWVSCRLSSRSAFSFNGAAAHRCGKQLGGSGRIAS